MRWSDHPGYVTAVREACHDSWVREIDEVAKIKIPPASPPRGWTAKALLYDLGAFGAMIRG
jgi:hypothetical protein